MFGVGFGISFASLGRRCGSAGKGLEEARHGSERGKRAYVRSIWGSERASSPDPDSPGYSANRERQWEASGAVEGRKAAYVSNKA
jgi:hypothetical protein